ncbi:MAG: isoprenylcysteine carboxylmethyltransferase family protein [Candidatus Latescibacteria bacterium]|nr:isoprenylcysteine carboxylmethyltransferase family protein [Candidatus Latescibacterota bacterium]
MSGESPDHPGVHFPPPLLFVVPLGIGWQCNKWLPLALLPELWRAGQVMAGWGLIVVAGLLAGWAMVTFALRRTAIFPNRPATALVTWGPFRYSRNPMYIAMSVLYIGVSMLINTAWALFFLPGVWAALYYLVIRREERYLTSAFGAEYDAYRARVRRWV